MSHVASVECRITDLEALKVAADKLGFEFVEDQKTFKWYGRWLNDWSDRSRGAVFKGHNPKTFGKCSHALRLKSRSGMDYEVGIVPAPNGEEGYDLIYDSYGPGRNLESVGGKDMSKLSNEYLATKAEGELERRGYRVEREDEQGVITLVARK